uniref:Uncharacterized protein n=1 Tax=uncultured marine group II/III euryarchaeote AD1000_68_A10 TaxID=1457799 RepID=A0A075FW52_9EURY|nr:hypothetical protein [uncultured marine group II/III euryarchaeote AD1000_68_A10]
MKNRVMISLFALTFFVHSASVASAHGEAEASPVLSNIQILLTSVSISVVVFLILRTKYSEKLSVFTPSIFSLALFTGLVHVLLGINDRILLLGGSGVLAIIASPALVKMNDTRERIAQFSLGALSLFMFIAYFISNHDIHYILEDYLGITAKISEIGLIIGLIKNRKSIHAEKA